MEIKVKASSIFITAVATAILIYLVAFTLSVIFIGPAFEYVTGYWSWKAVALSTSILAVIKMLF